MSEEAPLLQICDYWTYPDRYQIVDGFWTGHRGLNHIAFPENLCPKLAVFVTSNSKPIVFLACYQAVDIGVAILDLMCSEPGLSFAESRRAFLFGIDFIKSALLANDYGFLMAYPLEPVGRCLERAGWQDHGTKQHLMISTDA